MSKNSKESFEENIEKIIENALKRKIKLFKKYKNVDFISNNDLKKFKIVAKFLKAKKLKLYGGAAINMQVGKEDKFYTKEDTPDYDVYSTNPWDDAVELADLLYDEGYLYTEVKSGIHPGTYKVFSNLWPVCDISYVPPEYYNKIPTTKIKGFNVCEPQFLQISIYKEFQEPLTNPARWGKIAERQKLLEKWNPTNTILETKLKRSHSKESFFEKKDSKCSSIYDNDSKLAKYKNVLDEISEFIHEKKLIRAGDCAFNKYISYSKDDKSKVPISFHEVLSFEAEKNINEILKKNNLMNEIKIVKNFSPYFDLFAFSYDLIYKDKILLKIFQTQNCIPYKIFDYEKNYYVTVDMLKYMYLSQYIYLDEKEKYIAYCKFKTLEKIQKEYYKNKNIKEYTVSPFQRFVTRCKGLEHDRIKTVLFGRWKERVERKQKIRKINPNKKNIKIKNVKNKKIKICDREENCKECKDLSKGNCKYPCTWNKKINKCFEIPKGIYRAKEDSYKSLSLEDYLEFN